MRNGLIEVQLFDTLSLLLVLQDAPPQYYSSRQTLVGFPCLEQTQTNHVSNDMNDNNARVRSSAVNSQFPITVIPLGWLAVLISEVVSMTAAHWLSCLNWASVMGLIWVIIYKSASHDSFCFLPLMTVPLCFGPVCVSAGKSAVLRRPALQLQPTHTGATPAEAPLLRERPKEGPPEADPHDDSRPLRPQWTHCDWGGLI